MVVIVTVCTAFGVTVSEAKTEIMCLRTKGDVGCHLHIQRRGCRLCIQINARFRIPRGERQPPRRPVHRDRPAHTQRLVRDPDAESRSTRGNAVLLCHAEPARVPQRHAAQSPPLHRTAKAHSHRPPDLLPRNPCEDREGEHRGDTAQEVETRGGCGLRGGDKRKNE